MQPTIPTFSASSARNGSARGIGMPLLTPMVDYAVFDIQVHARRIPSAVSALQMQRMRIRQPQGNLHQLAHQEGAWRRGGSSVSAGCRLRASVSFIDLTRRLSIAANRIQSIKF